MESTALHDPARAMDIYRGAPWRPRMAILATGAANLLLLGLPAAWAWAAFEGEPLFLVWRILIFPCQLFQATLLALGKGPHWRPAGPGEALRIALVDWLLVPMAVSAGLVAAGASMLVAATFAARPAEILRSARAHFPALFAPILADRALRALLRAAMPDEASACRWERRALDGASRAARHDERRNRL